MNRLAAAARLRRFLAAAKLFSSGALRGIVKLTHPIGAFSDEVHPMQPILLCLSLAAALTSAADAFKAAEPSANDLSLEIQAIRSIASFNLSPDQENHLRKLATETAEPARERKAKVSKEYLDHLTDLRNALVAGDND